MKCYIAHITFECKTALKVGSNRTDFVQDAPIQRDFNDLPMIPGSSLAGVLRNLCETDEQNDLFGYEEESGDNGEGSKVTVSNALLLDSQNRVQESLILRKSEFLKLFDALPVREHVALSDKGTAKEHHKFDEEVLYAGTRFKCLLEYHDDSEEKFKKLLALFYSESFCLGGGTTNGYGAVNVLNVVTGSFDKNDDHYRELSSSLNDSESLTTYNSEQKQKSSETITYTLNLNPDENSLEGFFFFGSGYNDENNIAEAVHEYVVDYETGTLSEKRLLIPASSVRGAISHRTTYHYNGLCGNYIDSANKPEERVEVLFGSATGEDNSHKSNVRFSDVYLNTYDEKVFEHVKIDRLTGGASVTALFSENATKLKQNLELKIVVNKTDDANAHEAFEKALCDIVEGRLPLGGRTMKGYGVFQGTITKNGEAQCMN